MKCILCDQRKAKRYCPAKKRQICPQCCGEKRGVEINCPLDCPYFVDGQRYQQDKITKLRIKKEGYKPYFRRAELYNQNPEIFAKIEIVIASSFRADNKLKNEEVAKALELAVKTLDTEKKGILYQYRDESRIVDELSGKFLAVITEFKDSPELRQNRITVEYAREVLDEFLREIKFYIEADTNPQSYLIHISRYHPEKVETTKTAASPIILAP